MLPGSEQHNVRKPNAHERLTHLSPGGCTTRSPGHASAHRPAANGDRGEAAARYQNKSAEGGSCRYRKIFDSSDSRSNPPVITDEDFHDCVSFRISK